MHTRTRRSHTPHCFFLLFAGDDFVSAVVEVECVGASVAMPFHVSCVRSSVIIIANLPTCVLNFERRDRVEMRSDVTAINRNENTNKIV